VREAARNALKGCEEVFRPTGPAPGPIPVPPEGPIERRPGTPEKAPAGQTSVTDIQTNLASWEEARAAVVAAIAAESPEKIGPDTGFAEVGDDPQLFPRGMIRPVGGEFAMIGFQPVAPVIQPPMPEIGPAVDAFATADTGLASIGGMIAEQAVAAAIARSAPSGTPAGGTTADQIKGTATPDLAGALQESTTMQSVDVQRRSPVALDPHIRGYKWGQIYSQADGAFWTPARLDLDTMLNKIDPGMVQNVTVIPGPYGLRYGPGLAYIDIERAPTPRFECFTAEYDSALSMRSNGGQFQARETVNAGGPDFGVRASVGGRAGSDYTAGNGLKIPSSYRNQDVWAEYSYDINPHQRIDVSYMRYNQGFTEYPLEFFNVNNLDTYGMNVRVVDTDPSAPWSKLTMEGWYNYTNFQGDTRYKRLGDPFFTPGSYQFPELQRVDFGLIEEATGVAPAPPFTNTFNANTNGNVFSTGARAGVTLGDPEASHVNVGADFRYLGQRINEFYHITDPVVQPLFPAPDFSTNMPRSWSMDPGVYAEWSSPITDTWTVAVGARGDFVWTHARGADVRPDGYIIDYIDQLDQYDTLYAFYYTNKWKLDDHWTLTGGFGQGQRPPTLIERYADGLFLSMAQSAYTHMVGNPLLAPERDWQVDVGLGVKHEDWRAGVRFYHAWVQDYVTYGDDVVSTFPDARVLHFVNTPLATLAGVELDWEYDIAPRWTPFARMAYIDGRDRTIGQPLPSIPPMDSLFGVRFHDADGGRRWGIEFAARVVNDQFRVGQIRILGTPDVTPIEQRTPGFTVCNLRGYWNVRKNLNLIGGIDNLFDKTYQEHLDLRLSGPTGFEAATGQGMTRVLAPGFTPYAGINWIF
jgi:outer membrane receptor protein involved in Fe transport